METTRKRLKTDQKKSRKDKDRKDQEQSTSTGSAEKESKKIAKTLNRMEMRKGARDAKKDRIR